MMTEILFDWVAVFNVLKIERCLVDFEKKRRQRAELTESSHEPHI